MYMEIHVCIRFNVQRTCSLQRRVSQKLSMILLTSKIGLPGLLVGNTDLISQQCNGLVRVEKNVRFLCIVTWVECNVSFALLV